MNRRNDNWEVFRMDPRGLEWQTVSCKYLSADAGLCCSKRRSASSCVLVACSGATRHFSLMMSRTQSFRPDSATRGHGHIGATYLAVIVISGPLAQLLP